MIRDHTSQLISSPNRQKGVEYPPMSDRRKGQLSERLLSDDFGYLDMPPVPVPYGSYTGASTKTISATIETDFIPSA